MKKSFLLKLSESDKKTLETLAHAERLTQSAYIRRRLFVDNDLKA